MTVIINESNDGVSVKEFLFKTLGFSVAAVKRVKYREGGILVNGEQVTVRRILRTGDELTLAFEDRDEDENEYTVPVDIDIDVVYEDEYVTVVNKPPSMPAHPSLGHKDDTVANALAYRYRAAPYVFRPVNRLDRDTSGLMLIARDKISAGKLYSSMRRGEIKKSYVAALEGEIYPASGRIETYMCREDDSIVKRMVCDESAPGAKLAVTEYRTLFCNGNFSVVKAAPVTGRTHQLRVHFASTGHPIVGDTMYGVASDFISRQMLHASNLSFPHPKTGERVSLTAEFPRDFLFAFSKMGIDPDSLMPELKTE